MSLPTFGAEFVDAASDVIGGTYPLTVNGRDWGQCFYSISDLEWIAKNF